MVKDVNEKSEVAEVQRDENPVDYGLDIDEKAKVANFRADAIDAENTEHNMTVMEAVRAYPMASLWAFVMSCTIVSRPSLPWECG